MAVSAHFRSSMATVCLLVAVFSLPAAASVIVNGTRVVYSGGDREVAVRLTNKGTLPVLVQSWIDDGDMNASPDRIRTPFTLTPPVNRINADKSQTLRISYTGSPALPQDKESVYWLNVLEIPALKKNEADNRLQVAYRTRIKLFFRPAALADRVKAHEAADHLTWSVAGNKLTAANTSPYFVSLVSVSVKGAGSEGSVEGEMVPPTGRHTFTLPSGVRVGAGSILTYEYVNDWGALRKVDYTL